MEETRGKTPLSDSSGLLVDLDTREQLNAAEFENINRAIQKYLLRRPSDKRAPFTYEWFLKVHWEMFGGVWSWAGQIRKTDKNIGIEKGGIREALKSLENDYRFWVSSKMRQEELAARLHHRLVRIHPFENGNGRWARLMTNIHLKKSGLPLVIWPEERLVGSTNVRKEYLEAIRRADRHDFNSLISLQRRFQKL